MSKPNTLSTYTQTLYDIEDFEEKLSFLDIKSTQLTKGKFHVSLSVLESQNITVLQSHTAPKLYIKGGKSTDLIRFCFLTNSNDQVISHGDLIDYNYIVGFDATRDTNLVLPEKTKFGQIYIPQKTLYTYIENMQREDLNDNFFKRNYIRPCSNYMYELRRYFQQILDLINTESQLSEEIETLNFIEQDLIPLLIDTLRPSEKPYKSIRRFKRIEMVKKTEEYMYDHVDCPITLKDLCDAVGYSYRTLMYGFQDLFGMGVMSYLKIHRLNGVYRALKHADPDDMVMRIASHWGFWSMGHFSRDYKQMFGESPSETLRRD
ncbi:MAG: helix-turn-helix domain-containing protein [Cyanobacteriota bacterium]|nr:helix-turn-helix domain-containing protein [Cyanobacteriota bacterium]